MAKCGFCHRRFRSEQAVKAHLKHCKRYEVRQSKKACALGTKANASDHDARAAARSINPTNRCTGSLCAAARVCEVDERGHDETGYATDTAATTAKNSPGGEGAGHRSLSALVRNRDRVDVRSAKMLIERELASLPLEELPFEEVLEIAAAIRDGCYAPAFTRQAREATRRRVEEARDRKKEVETLGALLRADRRKKTLIRQANHQADAYCQEKAIIGGIT